MDALSDKELWGDVLSTLTEAIEAASNSERLWDRIRDSMARDPRGTNIMKKKDQVRVQDPKEVEVGNWRQI